MIIIHLHSINDVNEQLAQQKAEGFGISRVSLNKGQNRLILSTAIRWFHTLLNNVKKKQIFFTYTDSIIHKAIKASIKRIMVMDPPEADYRDHIGQANYFNIKHNRMYLPLNSAEAQMLCKIVLDYALEFHKYFTKELFYKILGVSFGLNKMSMQD